MLEMVPSLWPTQPGIMAEEAGRVKERLHVLERSLSEIHRPPGRLTVCG
jgi:hypothetical protein